jgi:hypothetical protein
LDPATVTVLLTRAKFGLNENMAGAPKTKKIEFEEEHEVTADVRKTKEII